MVELQRTISPVDGSLLVERPLATEAELERALAAGAVGDDPHGERRELLRMIDVARD